MTTIADDLAVAPETIRDVIDNFARGGHLGSTDARIGPPSAVFTPDLQLRLANKIDAINSSGKAVTIQLLQSWLQSEPCADDPSDKDRAAVSVSQRTVGRWLQKIGYSRQESKPGYRVTPEREARIREFLIDFSIAKKREESEDYVIAFMDESYLHVGHRPRFSIYPDGENRSVNTARAGKRMIIVHAITKDGPLVAESHRDAVTGFPKAEGWFDPGSDTGPRDTAGGSGSRVGGGQKSTPGTTTGHGGDTGRAGSRGGPADDITTTNTPRQPAAVRGGRRSTPPTTRAADTRKNKENRGADGGGSAGAGVTATGKRRRIPSTADDRSDRILRSKSNIVKEASGASLPGKYIVSEDGSGGPSNNGIDSGRGGGGTNTGGKAGGECRSAKGGAADGTAATSAEDNTAAGPPNPAGASPEGGQCTAGGARRWKGKGPANRGGKGKGRGGASQRGRDQKKGSEAAKKKSAGKKRRREDQGSLASRLNIKKLCTAEMIFEAGEKSPKSDYHKNMDADMFLQWLEKRFLPTFKEMYPGRRVILVLDNAPYHHGMPEGWKSPLKDTKEANAARLRKLGVASIEVQTDMGIRHFDVPADGKNWAIAPSGPSKDEVALATYRAIKQKAPQQLMTRSELFFQEHDIGYLLFTPPYCPALQPIELFWGHGKNHVARNFETGRTMAQAWAQLREGWYGTAVGGRLEGGAECDKLVQHCLEEVQRFIDRDEILGGSYKDLKDVPLVYKVSKECGLVEVEDDMFDDGDADAAVDLS